MTRLVAPLAGLITGIRFAAKSLEPSLMPRSALDQGLVMGGSFLTGFVAGTAAGTVVRMVPIPKSQPVTRIVGALATSARSAQVIRDPDSPPPVDASEAWTEVGAEVAAALALAGAGQKGGPPIATVASSGAVLGGTAIEVQGALARRPDRPDLRYVATASGVAAGLNLGVAGIVGVIYAGGRVVSRFAAGPVMRVVGFAGGAAAATALLGVGARFGVSSLLARIAAGNRMYEVAYSEPPGSASVSGSRYSLAPYRTLGLQGRRLVSEVTTADDIDEVMGEPARAEPVRVYVGVGSADTEDERVELAIQELRRTGGFDRSRIIAASPAGTGYVNYIAVEAAELMARGDVATVAVQYGEVPSMLSIDKVGDAARVYAKLVGRLRAEIDALDRDIRLAAYGESLGAITCQMGVDVASEGIDGLVVHDALWVGTPKGSKLFARLTDSGVPVFDHFDEVRAHLDAGGAVPDVFFLNHDNDPVTKFTPTIFHRMPEWLATTERGRNVEPHQRWLPGISFWQTLIDTKNAATVIPGEFFSTGHDYRADLAEFIRVAYGFDDVADDQMSRIEARLRQSEITRASEIAKGKVPAPS